MGTTISTMGATKRAALAFLLVVSAVGIAVTVDAHPAAAAGEGAAIVAKAASQTGLAYCDGGGGYHGASHGQGGTDCENPKTVGYDCMSLSQYAVFQAIGVTIPLGGLAAQAAGKKVITSQSALKPGDVVFFGNTGMALYAHDGVYSGNGMVWDASGTVGQRSIASISSTTYAFIEGVRYRTSS
jgi:cell wall-associated NlpC family hydrolase